MKKYFCDKCEIEVKVKNCYEIDYGKVTDIEEGNLCAISTEVKILCPKCYKEFEKLIKKIGIEK